MEGMAQFQDGFFDLAVVDPPYGLDVANMNMGIGNSPRSSKIENRLWRKSDWDKCVPDSKYFQELFRVSKNQIIWGGNYFDLPACRCFLIWDKGESMYGRSFSECEFAWTSFSEGARIYKHQPFDKNRFHPTQKPIALYTWIFRKYAKPGEKILDTHLGSGSSRIAAYEAGLDFIGFEIDPQYFEAEERRFEAYVSQCSFFHPRNEEVG